MYKEKTLQQLEAEHLYDPEDSVVKRTAVTFTKTVPGVGLLKAGYHGIKARTATVRPKTSVPYLVRIALQRGQMFWDALYDRK